ncbi:MAG: isoaspartyl peptidase/L-asparaginase [Porphyrobacter sp.]|nr:isoaspartyl peptidase/L-asparaginase [Porphyrobacter sp.]
MLAALAFVAAAPAHAKESKTMADKHWSLAIHGGAGVITRERLDPAQRAEIEAGLNAALDAGTKVLASGGSAVDAVQAVIEVLEDDPHFNAGRGAVFTYEGKNELDAAIMDGRNRAAGAVTGVTHIRHPVALARAVMDDGTHVFLSGAGAEEFARSKGFEMVDPSWFATESRRKALEEFKAKKVSWFDIDLKYGTVGAVARDAEGHVAAATSTGGLTGKRWGRIGDSPVIGAGTYADDRACAVSATGAGEFFIRAGVAHTICDRVRFLHETIQQAADATIKEVGALGGDGGVIVAGPDGSTAFSFNTPGMYRGRADSKGAREVKIFGDE